MTCEEFAKLLDNYENLTDEEKLAINEHALQCAHCREELDFTLAIIAELNALPAIEVPADFGAKLNERIDLEKGAAAGLGRRILNSARRNYGRYSAVAACLVLAVVIGANGKTLMERLNPTDDGSSPVIVTADKTPVSDTANTPADTADTPQTVDKTESVKQENASNNIQTAKADISAPARRASGQNAASITPIREMSESINEITVNQSEKAQEPVYAAPAEQSDKGRAVDENAGIAVASIEGRAVNRGAENYTIARGVYRLPDPEIVESEAPDTINTEPLAISEINSQPDTTIARGRYYIPSDDGYVSLGDGNEIGVNGEDAQRAAKLIKQYAEENDSYYVINSEDIPSMLEHMEGEGINYESNMESSENGKVGFKLVIE